MLGQSFEKHPFQFAEWNDGNFKPPQKLKASELQLGLVASGVF
jgi:hypothetical protein